MRILNATQIEPANGDVLGYTDGDGEHTGIVLAFRVEMPTTMVALLDMAPDPPVLAKQPLQWCWPPLGSPVATDDPGVWLTVEEIVHGSRGVSVRLSDGTWYGLARP